MKAVLAPVILVCALLFVSRVQAYEPKTGDIVFQDIDTPQGRAVELATHSRYTHMGLVLIRKEHAFVLEAYDGVGLTPLQEWIDRGIGDHVVIKRLQNVNLQKEDARDFHLMALAYTGREYDYFFEWSDEMFYCSELVWKMYHRILGIRLGELKRMRNFDLTDPFVRSMMEERFKGDPPLDEPVIAPDTILNSDLLREVYRNGSP
ncbi:MAG: YiiX/YebB-like N1pC/P60 family cysteine hydrolase [Desulfovibrionales bacterium]